MMFYLAPDGKMMAVEVRSTAGSLDFGRPNPLFPTRLNPPSAEVDQYDVTRDGQRFIVVTPPAESRQTMNLIVNWPALLRN